MSSIDHLDAAKASHSTPPVQLRNVVRRRVPVGLIKVAQRVCVKPRRAGQARSGKAAVIDETAEFGDKLGAHDSAFSHFNVIVKDGITSSCKERANGIDCLGQEIGINRNADP